MAKKPRKSRTAKSQHSERKKKIKWSRLLQRGAFAFALLAILAVAIHFFSSHKQQEYDLSVIGNGTPTVVQVHDPDCQLCQRLKRNLDSVRGDFSEDIQFRTTYITTSEGRRFANRYAVSNVTLLFFNKQGQHVHTLEGVTPADVLRNTLQRFKTLRGNYR